MKVKALPNLGRRHLLSKLLDFMSYSKTQFVYSDDWQAGLFQVHLHILVRSKKHPHLSSICGGLLEICSTNLPQHSAAPSL